MMHQYHHQVTEAKHIRNKITRDVEKQHLIATVKDDVWHQTHPSISKVIWVSVQRLVAGALLLLSRVFHIAAPKRLYADFMAQQDQKTEGKPGYELLKSLNHQRQAHG